MTGSLVPSTVRKDFLERATATYQAALKDSPAVEYLVSRGLSGVNAQRFRLGYVEEPLAGHEDWLRGRLAIPYLTPAGVVEIKFRSIDPEAKGPKFLYGSDSKAERIYNTPALFEDVNWIFVCEGEPDTWIAEQCGLTAVGIPGVQNWQPFFARVFSGYDRVCILGDADDAGQGEGFARELSNLITNSDVCLMPEGHDVNSFVLEHGADALRKRVGLA